MNQFAGRIMIVLIIGGLISLSCEEPTTPNRAPTITALALPDTIDASGDATLICTASDPDSGALAYEWTCSAGTLVPTTGVAVVWTAPESSGSATITVTVRDDSAASDTASGTVAIKAVTATFIDWDGMVEAGDYKLWSSNYIPGGYTVHGSFSVDAHDITFLMLDSANYQLWRFDSSYTALVKVEQSAGSGFSVVAPMGAGYHFILDNRYNVYTDSSAHLLVQTTSP